MAALVAGLTADAGFRRDLERFVAGIERPAQVNSLAATLLKLTSPGVPDVYQGTEIWDNSLVDPDNRRAVDFELRRRHARSIDGMSVDQVLGGFADGLPKLWTIRRALAARAQIPEAFGPAGTYRPIIAAGAKAPARDRVRARRAGGDRGAPARAATPRPLGGHDAGAPGRTLAKRPRGRIARRRRDQAGRAAGPVPGRAAGPRAEVTRPRVWAPLPERVELVVGDRRLPMTRTADGWWEGPEGALPAGTDYAFALDGGDPLPDPRSPWQPHGVHGPSRWVDHAAFAWRDQGWQPPAWASGVVYELHVGTFTPAGTFDSAIERLDHLVALGVSHVELMPVAEFPGERGWGYDGVDLFAPHHAYGGPDGLKRLIDAEPGVGARLARLAAGRGSRRGAGGGTMEHGVFSSPRWRRFSPRSGGNE